MKMYKLKTKRAAAKRYRVTGKGHVKVGRKGKRHLATGKTRKQKRQLRGCMLLGPRDEPMAKALLPHG